MAASPCPHCGGISEWVEHRSVLVKLSRAETGRWLIREIAAKEGDYLSATRLAQLRLADLEAVKNYEHWRRPDDAM